MFLKSNYVLLPIQYFLRNTDSMKEIAAKRAYFTSKTSNPSTMILGQLLHWDDLLWLPSAVMQLSFCIFRLSYWYWYLPPYSVTAMWACFQEPCMNCYLVFPFGVNYFIKVHKYSPCEANTSQESQGLVSESIPSF